MARDMEDHCKTGSLCMDKFDVGDDAICTGDTQQYWSCINMIAMAFNVSPHNSHLYKKIPPSPPTL